MARILDHFRVVLSGDATGLQKELNRASKNFRQAGKDMQRTGLGFSAAITAPFGLLSKSFIDAASEAEELGSKFSVVFGKNAEAVEKWAETYGDEVGRATTDIKDMAAGLQDLLVPMGLQEETATRMSKSFSALAIDVASFNNAQDLDVMRDFKSALIGNHETVQKYGVVINESIIKQKLAEMGMEDLTGAALAQAKVMARAKLIVEGTTAAHGDAARTAGSYANQQKALAADSKELSETLGQILMPIAMDLVSWAREAVAWFKGLSTETQKWTLIIGGAAAAIGPLLILFGSMATGAGVLLSGLSGLAGILAKVSVAFPIVGKALLALLSPFGLVTAAVVALGALFWTFRKEIGEALAPIGQFIHRVFVEPVDLALSFVSRQMSRFLAWLAEKVGKAAEFFGFDEVKDRLSGFQSSLEEFAAGSGPVIEKAVMTAGKAAKDIASTMLSEVGDLVDQAKAKIGEVADTSAMALDGPAVEGEQDPESQAEAKDAMAEADVQREKAKTERVKEIQLGFADFAKGLEKSKMTNDAKTWGGLLNQAAAGNKKLAKIQRAAGIGQVLRNQGKALSEAVASAPFPLNLPAIAFAGVQSAVALSQVKGQFHSGIDNVPDTGTYLLERGERVVDRRLNADLKQFLKKGGSGEQSPNINLTMHIGDKADPDAVHANRSAMEQMLRDIYEDHGMPDPLGA